jgi:hypothetical protein
MRSPRRTLAAATISMEALVLFLGGLVAKDLSRLPPGTALGIFWALAAACLVAAGLLRGRIGYPVGWFVQAAAVISGIWVPVMFFLGGVFAFLWYAALSQGARMERGRATSARE